MIEQNAAGLMTRKRVEDMDDEDVLAFVRSRVESYADEHGIDVDEALRRLTQEPVSSSGGESESAPDSGTDSDGFANPRDEPDTEDSMVSSSEPETDPLDSYPAYEQTRREMSGEVDDLEAQASRAFWSPREQAVPSAHQTQVIVEQIRRAYRR